MVLMQRRQWLEIHEQRWCPTVVRRAVTDFLRFLIQRFDLYASAVRNLPDESQIVDLCSGSGGPWHELQPRLQADQGRPVSVLLTDKFPNPSTDLPAGVAYHPDPVDALQARPGLTGWRTMFSCFHHFEPAAACRLLSNIHHHGQGLTVFEFTGRTPMHFFNALLSPLVAFVLMPLVPGWHWRRALFTYVLPIIPLVIGWDALISNLRTYRPTEIRHLCTRAAIDHRCVHTGEEHVPLLRSRVSWIRVDPA